MAKKIFTEKLYLNSKNKEQLLIINKIIDEYRKEGYILEQQGKDVFEYSVFGSPQQKIGDFTQTKLGVF